MANPRLSIVIPTYTGQDHISDCLNSVLLQKGKVGSVFETVIVVDGPNKPLRKIVESYRPIFKKADIPLKIHNLKNNRGRFVARYEGALQAQSKELYFVDDRTILDEKCLHELFKSRQPIVISNIIELPGKNIVNRTIFLLRRRIYGNKWGQSFEPYFITKHNFEKTPKGTAGLGVSKALFVEVCKRVQLTGIDSHHGSDDTRVLKEIIVLGNRIYRSDKIKLFYKPRANLMEEAKHLYQRGPKFIDYYLKPGTRYFKVLMLLYLAIAIILMVSIMYPGMVLFILMSLVLLVVLLSLLLAQSLSDIAKLVVGLLLVSILFVAGLISGSVRLIYNKVSRE